jgi:hypothetical protein
MARIGAITMAKHFIQNPNFLKAVIDVITNLFHIRSAATPVASVDTLHQIGEHLGINFIFHKPDQKSSSFSVFSLRLLACTENIMPPDFKRIKMSL